MTELCVGWQDCVVVVQRCWISVEQCLLVMSVCGLQKLKSYLWSYPDLSPDSLGGFCQRQLDFVTWRCERPLQWTELRKPFRRMATRLRGNKEQSALASNSNSQQGLNDWGSSQSQPTCFSTQQLFYTSTCLTQRLKALTVMWESLCPLEDLAVAVHSSLIAASLTVQSYIYRNRGENKPKRAEELFASICCVQGSGKQ